MRELIAAAIGTPLGVTVDAAQNHVFVGNLDGELQASEKERSQRRRAIGGINFTSRSLSCGGCKKSLTVPDCPIT
jgi:hypothetical protein